MDYKVDINKDKWFDVRKTTEVFEALKQEAETYCKNSDATGLAYQSFVASEAFMGQSADATKNFVGNGMGKMNSDIKEAVLKCLKNQEDLLTGFSEMVDSSPNAYIDYNTLKLIDQDFDGYYTNFKSIAQSVDEIINKLNNEFGKDLGEFPKPDKGGVQNAFNDMCGAESGGGYIKECQDKFISFDSTMSDHVRANDTVAFRDDITGKLTNATNAFSAGEAMPMPARFNDLKIKKFLNPDQNTDSTMIERYSQYNREENYCDDSDDVDEYLKARCDLDRINNADDNRGANDNTFDHNADDNRGAKDTLFDHNAANSILYPSMQIISSNPIIDFLPGFFQSFADDTKNLSRDLLGIEFEDLMRMSFAPWSLFAKPKGTDATDPFDDHGLYGGNQGSIDPSTNVFGTGWIIGEDDEIYDFVKKYEGYENYSDKQIHDLLNTLEENGCTYVAAANAIFWHYRNQGELFEKKIWIPDQRKRWRSEL
ncbi:MAG: hypothetical protein IKO84_10295 [Butyrivibrio sp.]|nr:hypothetical protein [Butyrivibrio sp.]